MYRVYACVRARVSSLEEIFRLDVLTAAFSAQLFAQRNADSPHMRM